MTLGKAGDSEVQAFPLADEPAVPRLARLAAASIDATDPLRRHKTTARPLYDAALGSLEAGSPVFDVVFLNMRGEVAEGARSNVFVERDGRLLTPPLSSGAARGVACRTAGERPGERGCVVAGGSATRLLAW